MLNYLFSAGFTRTYEQMKQEAPNVADFEPDANTKTTGLFVKKWTGVIRLQRKIMDLESPHLPLDTSKCANPEWVPRTPAKHTLTGHRGPVTALSFHPVFNNLATASEDATLKIWDWETGDLERTLKGHTRTMIDCEFDSGKASRRTVSCSYDLFVKLWNVDNDYQNFATLRGHEHSVSSARFLPGDDRVVSASRDQTIRIWSIATTHCIKVLNSHTDWIRCAVSSPDARLILTCSNDHTARILDFESGATKAEMRGHENVVEVAVFAPVPSLLAIRDLVARPANPRSAKIDALGVAFVATGSRDKTIKIWDALSGQCLWTFVGHDNWVRALAFHPCGKYLLSAADDHSVRIWDLKTGRCLKKIEAHDQFVASIVWGRQVVAGGGVEGQEEAVERPVNVMATASSDKTVKVWLPSTMS
ncbi:dynein regulator [Ramaria rubella]|nr:dynein regulator [Ramaria rubella]